MNKIFLLLGLICSSFVMAETFSYTGSQSVSNAGTSLGNNQATFKTMNANPQMAGVAGFFQMKMQQDSVWHLIQGILGQASANPAIAAWDQKSTLAAQNFCVTDPSGGSVCYNIVASADTTKVPADIAASFKTPISFGISIGATAAAAAAASPQILLYSEQGATGAASNGVAIVNNLAPNVNPPTTPPTLVGGGQAPPPTSIPSFSGYFAWKNPHDGKNPSEHVGLISLVPPAGQVGQPGMPVAAGMTMMCKEKVDPVTGNATIAFVVNLPAGPNNMPPGGVATMTGTGKLGLDTNNNPGPTGNWNVSIQPPPMNAANNNVNTAPPPPTMVTTINFATTGAAPTFVTQANTGAPTVDMSNVSPSMINNVANSSGTGQTCGTSGALACAPMGPPPGSGQPPAIPSSMLPPPPSSAAAQPATTITGVMSGITLNPGATGDLTSF